MPEFDDYRVDRTVMRTYKLGEEPRDCEYWLTKTPQERFDAMEYLRQMNYGYDPATERLQRVLTVVERTWR